MAISSSPAPSRIPRTPAAARALVAALDRESLSAGGRLGPSLFRRVVGEFAETEQDVTV